MNMNLREPADALRATAAARLAESAIATLHGLEAQRLRQSRRGRSAVARARQTAMYLSHVTFGLSLTRVGICFGRDRTTVRHACMLTEDRRDDPACEWGLTVLEAGLLAQDAALAARVQQ